MRQFASFLMNYKDINSDFLYKKVTLDILEVIDFYPERFTLMFYQLMTSHPAYQSAIFVDSGGTVGSGEINKNVQNTMIVMILDDKIFTKKSFKTIKKYGIKRRYVCNIKEI